MRAGNYAEAFCLWRPLAEAGDAQAQFSLGWMYHNGYGLAIDDRQTLRWWEKAAAQQLADASFALGMLFNYGDGAGIDRDIPKAADHYLHAARLGHEEAKAMLRALLEREPQALAEVTAGWGDAEWQLISSPASIKVDRANVRKRPSLKAEVLTRLVLGDQVLQLGREGRWVHIAIPNRLVSAWVHESLLE
jgi:TPR repeat protein